jgi:aryl-alcohol dehydrogenase-like predicted oxidoreductase
LYGFGQSEGILGEFLRGKRNRVTVTTKFGLGPNQSVAKHRWLIGVARQVLRKLPMIERRIKQRPGNSTHKGIFTAPAASISLDISLQELGTDYVDVFLMHEATATEAGQPDLLEFLENEVRRGRIRTYGLGTSVAKLGTDMAVLPAGCRVVQFNNSALVPHVKSMRNTDSRGLITFGVMAPLGSLLAYARRAPARVQAISSRAELDLADPSVLASMLINDALRANPSGVTLAATGSQKHLAANAAASEVSFTDAQRTGFAELIKEVTSTSSTECLRNSDSASEGGAVDQQSL